MIFHNRALSVCKVFSKCHGANQNISRQIIQSNPQLRLCSSKVDIPDPFDSHFSNSIRVENIKSSVRPWLINRMEKCVFQQLSHEEQATVFNRLLMVHCFDMFLYSKVMSGRRSTFDWEIVLPALCSLIDRSLEHGAKSFVIGLSQLSQLTTLSKLINSTEEGLLNDLLNCRDNQSLDAFEDDINYLVFDEDSMSNFIQTPSCQLCHMSLLGPPIAAPAVYPLMMGRAKALQAQGDYGERRVWPIFCYPLTDICSKETFANIVDILKQPDLSAGGTIHLILNSEPECVNGELKCSMESSSNLIKLLADMTGAPIVHVKAEEVDSVVYVMNLVADFRANHNRDIIVNLMGSSSSRPHKNVAMAGYIKEFLVGGKDHLVDVYNKELISNKVISKWDLDDRKEVYLKKLIEDYTNTKHIARANESTVFEKRVDDPLTGFSSSLLSKMIDLLNAQNIAKQSASISESIETDDYSSTSNKLFTKKSIADESGVYQQDSADFNNKFDYEACKSLAYASLLQEGYSVHIGRSHIEPAGPNPEILIPKTSKFLGEFKLRESHVSPFAMAGFQMGLSSTKDNNSILSVWEAPGDMEPSVLHDLINKYFGVTHLGKDSTTNVVFIVPSYLQMSSSETTEVRISCQPSRILEACRECDILANFSEQLSHCNFIAASVSSPASLFHLLRRQAHSVISRPLIIFLSNESCQSSNIDELTEETCFQPYISDNSIYDIDVKNIVLCTGRIYHKLKTEQVNRRLTQKLAIARLEQIFPFPYNSIIQDLGRFPQARIWWAQEESLDEGCWNYVEARLLNLFGHERVVRFAGDDTANSGETLASKVATIFDVIVDS